MMDSGDSRLPVQPQDPSQDPFEGMDAGEVLALVSLLLVGGAMEAFHKLYKKVQDAPVAEGQK